MTQSTLPANLHPKVAAFLTAIGGPGIILLILGIILNDDTLKTTGLSLLAGTLVGGVAGYRAPTADSEAVVGPANDALLGDQVKANLK